MRSQQPLSWFGMMALFLASAGCCCVQGMPGDCGSCGMGAMASCRSCSGGCGEVYVDEWVSQPPSVDKCCAGDCRPVRSLLSALWGSRFVQGCDMCGGGGCDNGCAGSCGYASAGGSGCTSCGGIGMPVASGGCNCGGGATVTEPMEMVQPMDVEPMPAPSQGPTPAPSVRYSPQRSPRYANSQGYGSEPRIVPGSYKVSPSRRVSAGMASQRINPAMQKIDAKRATYAH